MELTKENFNDFIGRLKFQNRGKGVDHHCTANPIFIVQSRERITGIDLSFDPETYWTDEDSECEWTKEEFNEQLAEYVADGGEHEDFDIDIDEEVMRGQVVIFRKLGYCENWEYVCAHLTRGAAEAFIKRKKHDHRKLRIYVDSQYWCWEFNAIIKGLLDGEIIMAPSKGAGDVNEIQNTWLKDNGFDGLYLGGDCSCELNDLVPCGGDPTSCCPGYKVMKDCNDLYAFEHCSREAN